MKINVKKINTYTGHRDCIYSLEGGHKPSVFYSAGGDGYVAQWDLENLHEGQLVAKVSASVYALHYYAAHQCLVVGQNHEGIYFIDVANKKIAGSIKLTQSAIFDITSAGNLLFVAAGDGVLTIVDMEKRAVEARYKLSDSSLRSLAFGNNSHYLTIGASDNNIYVFDVIKGAVFRKIQGHRNSVFSVSYPHPSSHLVSTGRDAHLNFWSVADDYELVESIPAHTFSINHIAFRNDYRYFATGSMDKTVKIWDYRARKLLKVIDKPRHGGHQSSVNKLYWSNYNSYLISASDDRSISVWDLELLD